MSMKLESALKQFHPKSPMFSDSSHSTSPERLKGMDTAAALGMTQQNARFGMHAFFAKNDVSTEDKFKTIEELTQYAMKVAPKLIVKASGNRLAQCMKILSAMALEDYARSAGSSCQCHSCGGLGMIYSVKEVVKYPGLTNKDGIFIVAPDIRNERVGEVCAACGGKGVEHYRCQCKGRGKVPDEEQTALQGVPVIKDCPRCSGRGYRRMPSSKAYNAIRHLVPDLNERTWRRNWKPFHERLVEKCYVEEGCAEALFNKVTN